MNGNRIGGALAIMAMACFMAAFFCLGWLEVPPANRDFLNTGLIALISFVSTAFGYYLGTSVSSAKKNDTIAQAVIPPTPAEERQTLNQAGFARLPLLTLLAFTMLLVAACATMKSDPPEVLAGKSLLAMKTTIISAAVAGDELCRSRTVAPAVCLALADCYKRSQPAYDLAADSLRQVLASKDAGAWRDYLRHQAAFRDIFDDVLMISSQYNLLGGGK